MCEKVSCECLAGKFIEVVDHQLNAMGCAMVNGYRGSEGSTKAVAIIGSLKITAGPSGKGKYSRPPVIIERVTSSQKRRLYLGRTT